MNQINIKNLFFAYPGKLKHNVFVDLSISIKKGEFVAILGPSGCGKTTLLNCIAGLLKPQEGKISISGDSKNQISLVFQEPLLLPWAKTLKNVCFGLEIKKVKKEEAEKRAREMLNLVRLQKFEDYYPNKLSYGMKQRVNLARALAVNPSILLLDEPFSNLDIKTKEQLENDLLEIFKKFKKTFIFATHNIDEAVYLADRILIFTEKGNLIKDIENKKNKNSKKELYKILK